MSGSARLLARSLTTAVVMVTCVLLVAAARQDDEGRRVFTGKGLCTACHGPAGRGTPLGPDLGDGEWLHVPATVEAIDSLIRAGVAKPKKYPAPMPPRGGARLSDAEVRAVARYVHRLGAGQ
jgi:mono/diheme cytochrome c family protein